MGRLQGTPAIMYEIVCTNKHMNFFSEEGHTFYQTLKRIQGS